MFLKYLGVKYFIGILFSTSSIISFEKSFGKINVVHERTRGTWTYKANVHIYERKPSCHTWCYISGTEHVVIRACVWVSRYTRICVVTEHGAWYEMTWYEHVCKCDILRGYQYVFYCLLETENNEWWVHDERHERTQHMMGAWETTQGSCLSRWHIMTFFGGHIKWPLNTMLGTHMSCRGKNAEF